MYDHVHFDFAECFDENCGVYENMGGREAAPHQTAQLIE